MSGSHTRPPHVLVVYPWVTDFKLYDEWMHPLGLYYLISLLRHNGCTVSFFNCLTYTGHEKEKPLSTGMFPSRAHTKPLAYRGVPRTYKRYGCSAQQFAAFLDTLGTQADIDLICIGSGMTYWIDGLLETTSFLHRMFPDTPRVIGGTSAQLIPGHLRSRLPGTFIFPHHLFDDAALRQCAVPVLNTLSTKGWVPELISGLQLQHKLYHGPVLTSLGCPHSCTYCASSFISPEFTQRSHRMVMKELDYMSTVRGITHTALYDDAFLYRPHSHARGLLTNIRNQRIPLTYHCPNGLHLRWLDREILDLMCACRFHTLRFGYESSRYRYQTHTSHKTDESTLARVARLLHEYGYQGNRSGIYVMAGLPGQTPRMVADEIEAISCCAIHVKPVFLSPVPHTPLYRHYATAIPDITTDPRRHNDTVFIPSLAQWDHIAVEQIKQMAVTRNASIQ